MRQVPRYGIIGNGRMARHFTHYLHLLSIPYIQWSRAEQHSNTSLNTLISQCNPIIILISDAVIETFIHNYPLLHDKTLVHFSGNLITPLAYSAHPLMTFNHSLYELSCYEKISFIIEKEGLLFDELLPGLANPHFAIPKTLKPLYHSLCVLSNNFTVLLWQKFFSELENTFDIPKHAAHFFLTQTCHNLIANEHTALTGPLTRGDNNTIAANLVALEGDPFQKVYQAFLEAYPLLNIHKQGKHYESN